MRVDAVVAVARGERYYEGRAERLARYPRSIGDASSHAASAAFLLPFCGQLRPISADLGFRTCGQRMRWDFCNYGP